MKMVNGLYIPGLNKRPEDFEERRQYDCDSREKRSTVRSDDCEDLDTCHLCIFSKDNFEAYKRYEESKPF
jgi:hypothetical protein